MAAIIAAKKRWFVSALAYSHRLHELGLLTDWNYRQLCIRLRTHFKDAEPEGGMRESSQALAKILGSLRASGVTRKVIAKDLAISVADLDDLLFGLVLTPVDGGSSPQPGSGNVSHATLKVM